MNTYGLDLCYLATWKYVEMRRFLMQKKVEGFNKKVNNSIIEAVYNETYDHVTEALRLKKVPEDKIMMFLSGMRLQINAFTDILFDLDEQDLVDYSKMSDEKIVHKLYQRAKKFTDEEKKNNHVIGNMNYYKTLMSTFRQYVKDYNNGIMPPAVSDRTSFLLLLALVVILVLILGYLIMNY